MNIQFTDRQRPALTPEQYRRGREVLDMLPPGIYIKCSTCLKWQHGGEVKFVGAQILCEECS